MSDTICTLCGNEIIGSGDQKTGRPAKLHPSCREFNNAISLLQNRLEAFRLIEPTKEKKKAIRSTFLSLANGMN